MRAAVLNEQPGRLEIEDVRVDDPGPGDVLLRTVGAGLCHSDLHFMEGIFRSRLPAVLGHESAGVVEAVGDGVSYVKPGDHVICCLSIFCGECRHCLSGHPNRCNNPAATSRPKGAPPRLSRPDGTPVDQFARLGGFAEMMLVHQNGLVKITDEMPLDRASLIGCGVTTGMGAVFRTAKVEPGSRVCVIGAGGIGLAAIQAARIAGAGQVIVVDVSGPKLQTARQMGGTDLVNAREVDDVVAAVKDLSGGGVDYSFEAIGFKETAEQAFNMLDLGGTATVIGMVPSKTTIEIKGMDLLSEKKLQGSMMGSNQFRVDMPNMVRMYLDGRLMLDEMVSSTITLDEVNDGYDLMRKGEATRTVIRFDS
ncbi:MAG: S-(hydroxymethyl)glutathione dehydrogenase / alcohol dehydrogenase [Acidimicrobiia bacterium]|nr:S-(hydroxymethyl)glutathione dehydrogenase / alcohol dehydrogenase [Acidimicrobiia bacterium]